VLIPISRGGNDPAIVLPDVDIDATAKEVSLLYFLKRYS
jgi:acyl-CoA reductase-like NAD-dependent aldehyde dehydrogenase